MDSTFWTKNVLSWNIEIKTIVSWNGFSHSLYEKFNCWDFLSWKYSWRPLVLFSRGTTQVWRFLAIFNRGNFVRNLMNSDFSPRSEVYRRRSLCLILLCRYKFETQLDFFNFYDFELPAEVSRSKIAENSAFWYHQYFISSKSDGKLWFMNSCDPKDIKNCFSK